MRARYVDREFRVRGRSWWTEEELTHEEGERLRGEQLDLLVTHTPPASVVRAMGFPETDASSRVVEETWESMGRPRLLCGHMHERFQQGNVTALGELDTETVE